MRKFSNITILTLSIGLVSAPPVLARQVVDPTDYIGYKHLARQTVDPADYVGYAQGTYIPSKNVRHERVTDDASKYVRQSHGADTTAEFARGGQNADDRESRRIGKILWKSDYVQADHSGRSGTKMLEWPLLWKIDHVQNELEWPLLWKISHVQSGHSNHTNVN